MGFLDDLAVTITERLAKIDELIRKNNEADYKLAIADLKLIIADLQTKLFDTYRENLALKEDKDLENKLDYREGVLWLEGNEYPYCHQCWVKDKKLFHVKKTSNDSSWICYHCCNSFWIDP